MTVLNNSVFQYCVDGCVVCVTVQYILIHIVNYSTILMSDELQEVALNKFFPKMLLFQWNS